MENNLVEQFRAGLSEIKDGVTQTDKNVQEISTRLQKLQGDHEQVQSELTRLRRSALAAPHAARGTPPGQVSDALASRI